MSGGGVLDAIAAWKYGNNLLVDSMTSIANAKSGAESAGWATCMVTPAARESELILAANEAKEALDRMGEAYAALCRALEVELPHLPPSSAPSEEGAAPGDAGVRAMWEACQGALARELVSKQLALESSLEGPHSTRVLALGVVQSEPYAREVDAFSLLAELADALGRMRKGSRAR
mmetsp:Transcript_31220/g.101668  ORF Transcript_31220/g.101668 Transcript_31220/m.101668 type:complete len:176 (-) Transcript_31220:596-1123(-)